MSKKSVAKLFTYGRDQAVNLPKEFRFAGDSVRIRKFGHGVLLEPIDFDTKQWFAQLDQFAKEPFMDAGRDQPKTHKRQIL
jgi:antitoxin VapB